MEKYVLTRLVFSLLYVAGSENRLSPTIILLSMPCSIKSALSAYRWYDWDRSQTKKFHGKHMWANIRTYKTCKSCCWSLTTLRPQTSRAEVVGRSDCAGSWKVTREDCDMGRITSNSMLTYIIAVSKLQQNVARMLARVKQLFDTSPNTVQHQSRAPKCWLRVHQCVHPCACCYAQILVHQPGVDKRVWSEGFRSVNHPCDFPVPASAQHWRHECTHTHTCMYTCWQ